MTMTLNSKTAADSYDLKELAALSGAPDCLSTPWTPIEVAELRPPRGPERLRIKVTLNHVCQGQPFRPQDCPVALAVRSATYRPMPVTVETTTFTTHFHGMFGGPDRHCLQYLHEPDLALAIMDYDTYREWRAPTGREYEMVRLDALPPELTLRWLLESRLRHFDRQMQVILDSGSFCAP